jgi:uroporphyrinogen decarboxylase
MTFEEANDMDIPSAPAFDRLRTALLCRGEPDRVPIAEGGIDIEVKEAFLGRPVASLQDDVAFWAAAGYDYISLPTGIRTLFAFTRGFTAAETGAVGSQAARRWSDRASQAGQVKRERYGLYGDGFKERAWAEEHRGIITSRDDFARFGWPEPEDLDYSNWEQLGSLLPPDMKGIAYQGWVFTPAWMLMGFETFSYALHEDPGLVGALFERIGHLQYGIFRRLLEYECIGGFWMPDDIAYATGLMVNPKVLRQHVFPWFRRMGEDCAAHELPIVYHSDGDLTEVLPDILDCGFTALHPIEPKAMDIVRLKQEYGRRLCLIGNLDLGYTLTRGTPAEVEAEVKERLRTIAPGGGYCLGSSNSVTEYVPLANFNAMREAVFRYGSYPIAL